MINKIVPTYSAIIEHLTNPLKKDIAISIFFRGLNIFFTLLILPFSLKVLSQEEYGVWLTISALNAWVSLFDFGTQNTLRNALSACSLNKEKNTGLLLTNSFIFTLIISILFICMSLLSYNLIDFRALLHLPKDKGNNINSLILFSLVIFGIKLFTNNFNAILMALQKTYLTLVIAVIVNILTLSLILTFYYSKTTMDLRFYGIVILGIDIIIGTLFPIVYLKRINFKFNFSKTYLSLDYFRKNLLSSNLKFFSLSILVVLTFFSNNFFIGIILSYRDVTLYNLASKYYNTITMISIVALNPIWTQVAINYGEKNLIKIGQLLAQLKKYYLGFVLLSIILILFDNLFYKTFGGENVNIAKMSSICAAISVLQLLYNNIYAYVLNGMNIVNIQIKSFFIAAILIYPSYFFFCKYLGLGITGAFLVQIIIYFPNTLVFRYTVNKVLKSHTNA